MKKYIVVFKLDTNDADYIQSVSIVDENELELLKKIAKVVMSYRGHNWETYDGGNYVHGDKLTEDEREFFSNLLPYGEPFFHTIDEIKYWELAGEEVDLTFVRE